MRRLLGLLGISAAVAVSGCVGGGERISYAHHSSYDPSYVADAAVRGPIPVRVYGEPQAGAGELATAGAIANAMKGVNIGTEVEYVPAAELPNDGYVMIVRFGDAAAPSRLCEGGGAPGAGTDYAAAFCLNDEALSYLAGAVGDGDIASSGFRSAMATTAVILLPPDNPEYNDCDRRSCN